VGKVKARQGILLRTDILWNLFHFDQRSDGRFFTLFASFAPDFLFMLLRHLNHILGGLGMTENQSLPSCSVATAS